MSYGHSACCILTHKAPEAGTQGQAGPPEEDRQLQYLELHSGGFSMRTDITGGWYLTFARYGLAAVAFAVALLATTTARAAEACTLLSTEEVSQILGQRVRKPLPDTAQAGTSCRFPAVTETVNISLWPTNASEFQEFRKTLAENGARLEDAASIGDSAYFWEDNRIYVRVGDQGLTVTLAGAGDGIGPKRRAVVLAIATAGVAKLR